MPLSSRFFATLLTLILSTSCGCSQSAPDALTPESPTPSPSPIPPEQTPTLAPPAAASFLSPSLQAAQTWSLIKNYPFDRREEFITGITRLKQQIVVQIAELKSRRLEINGDINAWDNEVKRLDDSRSFFQSECDEIQSTTSDDWAARQDKIERAWLRLEESFAKVRNLTPA